MDPLGLPGQADGILFAIVPIHHLSPKSGNHCECTHTCCYPCRNPSAGDFGGRSVCQWRLCTQSNDAVYRLLIMTDYDATLTAPTICLIMVLASPYSQYALIIGADCSNALLIIALGDDGEMAQYAGAEGGMGVNEPLEPSLTHA